MKLSVCVVLAFAACLVAPLANAQRARVELGKPIEIIESPEKQSPEKESPEKESPEKESPETESPETESPETESPEESAIWSC